MKRPHLISTTAAVLALTFSTYLAFAQGRQERVAAISAALRNQEFSQALELVNSALQDLPGDPHLWTLQGRAYAGEGQRSKAMTSFGSALKSSPDFLPALEGMAQIKFEAGSMEAIPVLQHILRLMPGDTTSHAMIAVLEYRRGDCAAASPHFETAGSILDSQLDALHAYATCLVKLKQVSKAIEVFQRALLLQPEDTQQRNLLASLQLMAHRPQDAIATLGPLIEAANPSAGTLELSANAYEDAGETEKAVSMLRQAILADPQNIGPYLDFAQISSAHDSFQVGINVVSDGISQQPNSAQLYFARGVLYVQLADYDNAEADLAKAYELDPNESLTAAAQGLLAVQQNDLDRARADVKQKLKRKPDDPVLLYLQADVLAQQGAEPGTNEFQLALQSAKRAVALRPTLAAARAVLAKLYLQSGKNAEAAEQCRKALQVDPKDQTSLYRLIQALRKSGQTAQVPELLKRLAVLRQDSAKEQKQRNRYKLVEGDAQP
jgi:tetratricopeptide (TPR) repeat protein